MRPTISVTIDMVYDAQARTVSFASGPCAGLMHPATSLNGWSITIVEPLLAPAPATAPAASIITAPWKLPPPSLAGSKSTVWKGLAGWLYVTSNAWPKNRWAAPTDRMAASVQSMLRYRTLLEGTPATWNPSSDTGPSYTSAAAALHMCVSVLRLCRPANPSVICPFRVHMMAAESRLATL